MAHGEAVRLGRFVNMVGGDHAAGARHVIDDERWIAGDMFPQMARQGARVNIEPPAGGKADDDPHRLTAIVFLISGMNLGRKEDAGEQNSPESEKATIHF